MGVGQGKAILWSGKRICKRLWEKRNVLPMKTWSKAKVNSVWVTMWKVTQNGFGMIRRGQTVQSLLFLFGSILWINKNSMNGFKNGMVSSDFICN